MIRLKGEQFHILGSMCRLSLAGLFCFLLLFVLFSLFVLKRVVHVIKEGERP